MSMPAAKQFDLVLGVDIHWELVPMPAPTPTPIPNPFVGFIYDPMGAAIGVAMNNLIAAAFGEQTGRGIVRVNGMLAANVGTECRALVPHIMFPPGTGWAPCPGAPMPMVRPSEPPEPPTSATPTNDAMIVEGADTVTVMGTSFARAGCMAMSCGEPVRLPSSAILPLPIGAPVLIGGPTSINLLDAAFGAVRTRWVSGWLHSLFSLIPWRRGRNFFRRLSCFLTGHPVDVANGRLITENVDFELPGPLPLTFERIYFSSWANRNGPFGYGWTHTLNQSVWVEADEERVIYQDDEGRELTFHTHELPDGRTRAGDELYDPITRLTLVDRGDGRWQVRTHDGIRHDFEPVGRVGGAAMLRSITDRVGHAIKLSYDARGFLTSVLDSAGRTIGFRNDAVGRIVAVDLPGVEGAYIRYKYDAAGDLVRAWHPCQSTIGDDSDPSWWYQYQSASMSAEYRDPKAVKAEVEAGEQGSAASAENERSTHLLIREIDRNRLTFWFQYDGLDETARCVRTWGDHGIYDHTLGYAEGATHVRNSLGELTIYELNLMGQVVSKGVRKSKRFVAYEHDERTLQLTSITDELGHVTRYEHDERGNVTRELLPDGASTETEYDEHNLPIRHVDANGSEWTWVRDEWGRVKEALDPEGHRTRWNYRDGLPQSVTRPGGAVLEFEHDRHQNLSVVRCEGREHRATHDELGRAVEIIGPNGTSQKLKRTPLGWVTRITLADGNEIEHEHDHEGRLTLRADHSGRCEQWEHEGFVVVARHDGDRAERLEYDAEERLTAIVNAGGERHSWERDRAGRVLRETGFDGVTRRFSRDAAGQVTRVYVQPDPADPVRDRRQSTIERDPMGRITAVDYTDGTFARFAFRADGLLVRHANEDVTVQRELDALGRLVRERTQEISRGPDGRIIEEHGPEHWVSSGYGPAGHRVVARSSLGFYQHDHRDILGDLTRVEIGEHKPWAVDFERDRAGLEVARRVPGDLTQRTRYDDLQRPTHRTIRADGGKTVVEEHYGWGWGERLEWRWLRGQGTTSYTHDETNALVKEEPAGENAPTIHRARDAAGNLYRTPDRSDCIYEPGGRILEAYGTRYEHDLDGNLTEIRHPDPDAVAGESVTRLAWNMSGSLRQVERPDETLVRFVTDALGRRVRKELVAVGDGKDRVLRSVSWLWDGDVPIHERVDGEEPIIWVHEPDRFAPLGRIQGRDREAIFTDYLGTPTEGATEAGAPRWQMRLDAFGEAHFDGDAFGGGHVEGGASVCPWRWPGQYFDEETGLAQNRFRYYSAGEGRFISADPIGLLGGLLPYAYPGNPLARIDPWGLYEVLAEASLAPSEYTRADSVHFRESNRQLASAMRNDPALRARLEGRYPSLMGFADRGIRDGVPLGKRRRGTVPTHAPQGVTWHHHPTIGGLLQLVDALDHKLRHGHYHPDGVGGRNTWGGGSPCRK